ncbi:hypothetical protein [Pseudofrankia sp. BMG5.36]|uniref:hypothetical protein n=1 Tax=Pseudofrankia sp. BMG5.36 TaxID=1834512 RepID=UPI0012FF743B|nr:hypothetical protein [Pseudofrankia sp. BMG5.36]
MPKILTHNTSLLTNLVKHSIDGPGALTASRLMRMRYRSRLLAGCIVRTGLDLVPP